MPPDHISYRTGIYRSSGYIRRHDNDDQKSGESYVNHDTMGSVGQSVPPSICPNCEIPIYPGSDHRDGEGCFAALKAFVKLCQDDIENSRMRDFQHPTRDELREHLVYLEDQFEKFTIYTGTIRTYIRNALRGTLIT